MNPIVNGLEQDYAGRVAFSKLDATGAGKAAFEAARLPGHPSYVIFQPSGAGVWQFVGVRSRDELAKQLDSVIAISR